jgi:hypothetical protein
MKSSLITGVTPNRVFKMRPPGAIQLGLLRTRQLKRQFISVCVASFLVYPTLAAEGPIAPRLARTTEDITKAVEGFRGFGCVQSAQFSRWGRQVFAVWYCPFSGRDACYLHAYYFDHEKARWIRFVDRLVEGSHDLSAEMPTGEEVVIFKGTNGTVKVKESVAKFPKKKWFAVK